MQRLESSVCKPAVKRRRNCPDSVLQECKAFLQGVGIEGGATHQDIGMPIDIFGHRMNHKIGTMIQRILDVRAQESIVDDDHDTFAVRNGRHLSNIHQAQRRIARAFYPDQFRLPWTNHLCDIELNAGRECHLNAVRSRDLGEVPVCATVDIRD